MAETLTPTKVVFELESRPLVRQHNYSEIFKMNKRLILMGKALRSHDHGAICTGKRDGGHCRRGRRTQLTAVLVLLVIVLLLVVVALVSKRSAVICCTVRTSPAIKTRNRTNVDHVGTSRQVQFPADRLLRRYDTC